MTVTFRKDEINIREKLSELDKDTGLAGARMLAADTPAEQFELINAGRKNLLINGNFQIAQRRSTYSTGTDNGYLTADRWFVNNSGGTSAHSLPDFTVGQTDVPGFPQKYYRFESTIGNNNQGINQRVEDVRVLGGRTVTLSFWAKGTNPTAGHFVSSWIQNFGIAGSSDVETLMDDKIVLTPNWKKYTITTIVPSISGKTVGEYSYTWVEILRQAHSDTGTGAWTADIANVQLEFGSVATPFEHRSYGEELALCQRYYEQSYTQLTGSDGKFSAVAATGSNYLQGPVFKVTKRVPPSMIAHDGIDEMDGSGSTLTAQSFNHIGVNNALRLALGGSGRIDGQVYRYHWSADAEI